MRISDFWRLMEDEFGAAYAHSLAPAERWLGRELRSPKRQSSSKDQSPRE